MRVRGASGSGRRLAAALGVVALAAGACASSQSPVLYPNSYLEQVGREQAERDVDACRELASEHIDDTAG